MQLKKIITLASSQVQLRFTAMERSLRATGCTLPLLVIPYNDDLFDLPPNAAWLRNDELFDWLGGYGLRGVYRKYACLLEAGYLFVDSDVIFLENPEKALAVADGFITCCGHWHNTAHTTTHISEAILRQKTTTWQARVFNTGQFACSTALYTLPQLKQTAADARYAPVCLARDMHEQPGINLLVNLTDISITNLTLPPYHMESTWAGDYTTGDYEKYWTVPARKPFIIHWAGRTAQVTFPIDQLFFRFLTEAERQLWKPAPPKRKGLWQRIKQLVKQKWIPR